MVHFTVLPIHLYICTYNLYIRTHRHTPAGWWSSPAHCSSWTSLGGVSGGGWSSPCTHTWGSGWCGTQSGLHQTEHTQSASNSRTQTDTANTTPHWKLPPLCTTVWCAKSYTFVFTELHASYVHLKCTSAQYRRQGYTNSWHTYCRAMQTTQDWQRHTSFRHWVTLYVCMHSCNFIALGHRTQHW